MYIAYKNCFCCVKPDTSKELPGEPIQFNYRIKLGNKVISVKIWLQNGLYCISHFYSEAGCPMSHGELIRKCDVRIDKII